jgi:hypothetical protein
MASSTSIPAPTYLPGAAAAQWRGAYEKAFAQAKIDHPNNPSAQRATALKAANARLAVNPPTSATDIDKLEPWQVLVRETRNVKGQQMRICVTTDGRKYSFPVQAAPLATQASIDLGSLSKADLVDHASSVHGLALGASLTKAEMIDAINAHVEAATAPPQS